MTDLIAIAVLLLFAVILKLVLSTDKYDPTFHDDNPDDDF